MIRFHEGVLAGEFFVSLVRHVVRLELMMCLVAGEGTVVDAAENDYKLSAEVDPIFETVIGRS